MSKAFGGLLTFCHFPFPPARQHPTPVYLRNLPARTMYEEMIHDTCSQISRADLSCTVNTVTAQHLSCVNRAMSALRTVTVLKLSAGQNRPCYQLSLPQRGLGHALNDGMAGVVSLNVLIT